MNATILLVEDDENDYIFVRTAFAQVAGSVALHRVCDGEEAIQYFAGIGIFADRSKYPLPSLVLLDIKLPRRNGFEVLSWLRAHDTVWSTIVLMHSASNQAEDVKTAYREGANAFLVKPHTLEKLTQMVHELHAFWFGSANQIYDGDFASNKKFIYPGFTLS